MVVQTERLLCPVILPQRRPRTKSRSFVRACGSVLKNAGIDKAVFLTFLKSLHKHSQASPVFDVIIVAAGIAGLYPDIVAGAVSTAIAAGAMVG